MINRKKLRWYGWGDCEKEYPLNNLNEVVHFLKTRIGEFNAVDNPVPLLSDLKLPPSKISDSLKAKFYRIAPERTSSEKFELITHCAGKSYRDVFRLRKGIIENTPDLIIYPQNEQEISQILELASEKKIAVIPFGGGSSVLGGVEPICPKETKYNGIISIDLTGLDRILSIDLKSLTAQLEAGISGPEIEEKLGTYGLSLGHFPQSFEYSTLGGWIATRSAGQNSTLYGKIDDMVQSLRIITPVTSLEFKNVPSSAAGPDIGRIFIGSEGKFGIIYDAVMKVHPLPTFQIAAGFIFKTLEYGTLALKKTIQEDIKPAVFRLSDPEETETFLKLGQSSSEIKRTLMSLIFSFLSKRGFKIPGACFLICILEGEEYRVRSDFIRLKEVISSYGGFYLGKEPGRKWLKERYRLPYLRDRFIAWNIMVDTLETAVTWDKLPDLYEKLKSCIEKAIIETGSGHIVLTHFSHIYKQGASLYVTFVGRQSMGREIEQWWWIKDRATECILDNGGTLSHHHGIGTDHLKWLDRESGKYPVELLKTIRNLIDPEKILNPGKLWHE